MGSSRQPRVAFVAVRAIWEDPGEAWEAFTYAARKLEASVRSAPDLGHVETIVIDLPTLDPQAFFAEIEAFRPTLVAASAYIWSLSTLLDLAAIVRAWDPSVRFVMGGPAVRKSVLSLPPYRDKLRRVDALATGEGEEIVRHLARHDDLDRTPGLLIPHALGLRATEAIERPTLDDYASPYQLERVPARHTGFVETFRGCPIHCAFCQWGDQRADRVHGADYLETHLRGVEATDASSVFFVDAAFNLSPRAFRNIVEAERRTGVLRTRSVHGHLYPTFLKEEHLQFFDGLGHVQAAIGIQSFDEAVLARLGRPFDLDRFEGVLRSVRGRIQIDVEVILGLPGDSPASFMRTLERCVELSDTIRIFYCLALPDALIERADEFAIDFDPESFRLRSCEGWSEEDLRSTWERVVRESEGFANRIVRDSWIGFATNRSTARPRGLPQPLPRESTSRLTARLSAGLPSWTLQSAHRESEAVLVYLDSPHGQVVLEVALATDGRRCFSTRGELAYSYRGQLAPNVTAELHRVIDVVHEEAVPIVRRATVEWRSRQAAG